MVARPSRADLLSARLTGISFGQWRTRARTYRAAQLLSKGWSVQDVAAEVGYATATGFIKAYRNVYNATPAAHAARHRL